MKCGFGTISVLVNTPTRSVKSDAKMGGGGESVVDDKIPKIIETNNFPISSSIPTTSKFH